MAEICRPAGPELPAAGAAWARITTRVMPASTGALRLIWPFVAGPIVWTSTSTSPR